MFHILIYENNVLYILLFHLFAFMLLIFQIRLYQAHDMTVGLRKNETLYDFEYFFNKEQAKA